MIISRKYVGMGLAAMVVSMSAGMARGQSEITGVKPEVKVRKHVVRAEKEGEERDAQDRLSINIVNDEDAVSITIENGKVTSAKRNGKSIPSSQVKKNGGHIQFLGEGGKVEFEMDVDHPDTYAPGNKEKFQFWTVKPGEEGTKTFTKTFGDEKGTWSKFVQPADPTADQPKAMIGVQLAEPDRSLLGHFGLKPGLTTLVSAVYEGLPAAEAGLRPYDIIIAVNGSEKNAGEGSIRKALRDQKDGGTVTFTIIHEGKRHDVKVKLAPFDQERLQKAKVNSIAMEMDAMNNYVAPKQFATFDMDGLKDQIHSHMQGLKPEDTKRLHEELSRAMVQADRAKGAAKEEVEKALTKSAEGGAQRLRLFRGDGAARAEAESGAGQDRVKGIEERLDRLEKMLGRIIEKQDKQGQNRRSPGGSGSGAEKAPETGAGES